MKQHILPGYKDKEKEYGYELNVAVQVDDGGIQLFHHYCTYKINRIPDKYWGPPIGLVEELTNDPENKPCPVCGYKVYVWGEVAQKALSPEGHCRVCNALGFYNN